MTEEQIEIDKMLTSDRNAHLRILAVKLQLEELDAKTDVQAVSYENTSAVMQSHGNSTEKKYIHSIDTKDYLLIELADLEKQIESSMFYKRCLFKCLDNSELYCIATMLYISYLSFDKIAEIVGCEEKTVSRKKKKILNAIMSFNVG